MGDVLASDLSALESASERNDGGSLALILPFIWTVTQETETSHQSFLLSMSIPAFRVDGRE